MSQIIAFADKDNVIKHHSAGVIGKPEPLVGKVLYCADKIKPKTIDKDAVLITTDTHKLYVMGEDSIVEVTGSGTSSSEGTPGEHSIDLSDYLKVADAAKMNQTDEFIPSTGQNEFNLTKKVSDTKSIAVYVNGIKSARNMYVYDTKSNSVKWINTDEAKNVTSFTSDDCVTVSYRTGISG